MQTNPIYVTALNLLSIYSTSAETVNFSCSHALAKILRTWRPYARCHKRRSWRQLKARKLDCVTLLKGWSAEVHRWSPITTRTSVSSSGDMARVGSRPHERPSLFSRKRRDCVRQECTRLLKASFALKHTCSSTKLLSHPFFQWIALFKACH